MRGGDGDGGGRDGDGGLGGGGNGGAESSIRSRSVRFKKLSLENNSCAKMFKNIFKNVRNHPFSSNER